MIHRNSLPSLPGGSLLTWEGKGAQWIIRYVKPEMGQKRAWAMRQPSGIRTRTAEVSEKSKSPQSIAAITKRN